MWIAEGENVLDIRTILTVLAIQCFTTALAFLFIHRRKLPVKGTAWWTGGFSVFFVAALFFAFRGTIPAVVSIVAGNCFMVFALFLFSNGIRIFLDQPPFTTRHWLLIGAGLCLYTGVNLWFTYVIPFFALRAALGMLIYGAVTTEIGLRLLRGERLPSYVVTGAALLIFSAISFLRAGLSFMDIPTTRYFEASLVTSAYIASISAFILLLAVGLAMMTNEKLLQLMEKQALTDPLTGLANRRALFREASMFLARIQRAKLCMCVIMADLDNFKVINDRFGHPFGDEILKHFTRVAADEIRAGDVMARYGGEEFAIILAPCTQSRAEDVAERIRSGVERSPYVFGERTVRFTVSLGVGFARPEDETIDKIIHRADAALYRAKEKGRNRVEVYSDRCEPFRGDRDDPCCGEDVET